ncbi:uncharacterized protein LOC124341845 [Daphnia pulicaria]|uniref:uncharacterized protein LOC124341845 n=1 Tax=Daphnia pulicaria TaxID=35523 RepID=UPI001EEAF81C|nr:uncharacterized protein LOC124341845 [Daphnia pulicaria]
MVRGGQYSDESDSDWDSLSQAVPPPPASATAAEPSTQSAQPADERPKLIPAFNEIVRPNSDSLRSMSAASTAKGPLTFIDRQLNGDTVASPQSSPDSSPVVSLRTTTKKELQPHQVQHRTSEAQIFDEELPVIATDIKDVEFQPTTPIGQQQQPTTTKQFKSPVLMSRRPTDNSISYSSSDGFDNVAFEGPSSGMYSCSPPIERAKTASVQQQQPLPKPDETIEIFSYDKTNPEFNQVSERRRQAMADGLSETVFEVSSRFCSELTAVIGLPLIIALAVLLQSLRFVTAGLLRPLLIGLVMGISDGLVKPLLAAFHNGVVVPVAAFLHNVASAVKTSLVPVAGIILLMTEPLGRLLQSCRLIDIHHHHHKPIVRDV